MPTVGEMLLPVVMPRRLTCVEPTPLVVKVRLGTVLAKSRNCVAPSTSRLRAEIAVTDSGVSLSFCSNFCAVTTTSSSTDTFVEVWAVAGATAPRLNRLAAADSARREAEQSEFVMAVSPCRRKRETSEEPNPDKFFRSYLFVA